MIVRRLLSTRRPPSLSLNPVTYPLEKPRYGWGDAVEYFDFFAGHGPQFKLALIKAIIDNGNEGVADVTRGTPSSVPRANQPSVGITNFTAPTPNPTLVLLTSQGQTKMKPSTFVRFTSARLLGGGRPPSSDGELDQQQALSVLKAFEEEARTTLIHHHHAIEAAISAQLRGARGDGQSRCNLIYEWDMAQAVFTHPSAAQLYSVHLYLHSYCDRYGRDASYNVQADQGAGPYFCRSLEDQDLIKRLRLDMHTASKTLLNFLSFLDDVRMRVRPASQILKKTEFAAYIVALRRAITCHWIDAPGNPFVEFAQRCLTAGATTSMLNPKELITILRSLDLWPFIMGKDLWADLPLLQSGIVLGRPPIIKDIPDDLRTGSNHPPEVCQPYPGPALEPAPRCASNLALAIDAEGTVEVDDAISIGPDGWLHVHIANPAFLIPPKSMIDEIAAGRISSVYTANSYDQPAPMLPEEVSSRASLDPRRSTNRVITFSALLDSKGDISNYRISQGRLEGLRRITYDDADRLLMEEQGQCQDGQGATDERPPEEMSQLLHKLFSLSSAHHKFRLSRGLHEIAIPKGHPKVEPVTTSEGKTTRTISFRLDHGVPTPSHRLVSEAMIIAGRVAAMYAQETNLVIPYRYHLPPSLSTREGTIVPPSDTSSLYERLRWLETLSPSALDVCPREHWAMALPFYAKATSPLRRYADLLLHQQLLSSLASGRGHPSRDDLPELLPACYRHEQYLRRLDWASRRYWTLAYLEQELAANHGQPLPVTVIPLAREANVLQLFIEQYGLRHFHGALFGGAGRLRIGEPISMLITCADAHRNELRLTKE